MSYNIHSGQVSNGIIINLYDYLYVSSGGVANATTVNGGGMYVSKSGLANATTVNSGGRFCGAKPLILFKRRDLGTAVLPFGFSGVDSGYKESLDFETSVEKIISGLFRQIIGQYQ